LDEAALQEVCWHEVCWHEVCWREVRWREVRRCGCSDEGAPMPMIGYRRARAAPRITQLVARLIVLAFVVAMAAPLQAASLQGMGVVFLHGKGVWPGAFDGGIPGALEAEGALVESPEMPWSFRRMYGATFDQAMTEIDAAVAGLEAKGASRIVIIGHSLGANAAIGYAARRRVVAAVVAIAPGHLPETEEMRARTRDALAEARQMYAAGQQDRHIWPDLVQGIPTFATATPAVYLSMFDPDGPAVIPKNTAALRAIPFLWVVGDGDPIHRRGRDYAFARGAKNPASRYIEVSAGHLTTALAARVQIVEWLKAL
jgi:pimeloyl-ACP methyl ester carboxylesterase